MKATRPCSFPDCDRPLSHKGYCVGHHSQMKRGAELAPLNPRRTVCSVNDCGAKHYSLGYCTKHYHRLKSTGDPLLTRPSGRKRIQPEFCTVDGCENSAEARGWCSKHYARWLRHHDLTAGENRAWVASNGYEQRMCAGHPAANEDGQIYTHRMVVFDDIGNGTHPCHWCAKPVTWFTRNWHTELVVDHVNGDKLDNRRDNLVQSCNRCNVNRDRRSIPTCRKGHKYDAQPKMRNGNRVCQVCLDERRAKERAKRVATPWPELTHCLRGHEYDATNTYVTRDGYKKCRACRRMKDRGEL